MVVLLATIAAVSGAAGEESIYGKESPIVELDAETFSAKVLEEENAGWLVHFYVTAPEETFSKGKGGLVDGACERSSFFWTSAQAIEGSTRVVSRGGGAQHSRALDTQSGACFVGVGAPSQGS